MPVDDIPVMYVHCIVHCTQSKHFPEIPIDDSLAGILAVNKNNL